MRSTIKKPLKYIFPVIILLPVILFFQSCASFGYTEEEVFTSPQGSNTIIVKYDFVCRPDVFKKGWLWDKKIWSYPKGGFMETVHFRVGFGKSNSFGL